MNPLNLAFLAPFVMAWGTIKQSFQRVSSLLFVHGELEGWVADHMHYMLWTEWKAIPMGPRRHFTRWHALKELHGAEGPVVFSSYKGPLLFRKGCKVVSWQPTSHNSGKLICVRGNVNYDKLVEEVACRAYARQLGDVSASRNKGVGHYVTRFQGENVASRKLSAGKPEAVPVPLAAEPSKTDSSSDSDGIGLNLVPYYKIYPMVGRAIEELGYREALSPLQKHYVDPSLDILLQETETWLAGVDWMRQKGISHRRGLLLEGEPGTGKSSLIKTIAEHFGIPLTIVDLATCSDYDLPNLRALARNPGIFLFEDIDRVFEGAHNITERETDKVSFDAFLNLLSGADALEGVIVLTSNHPEKLDPALIRPGRIDRRVVVPLLSAEGRLRVGSRILEGCDAELLENILAVEGDQPAANFENTCIQAAMNWYWEHNLSKNNNTCKL